jgi:hypothetical protein
MDIDGCGVIRHIWITIPDRSPQGMRNMILRMYWDKSEVPSVEVPLGDFLGVAHGRCRNTAIVTRSSTAVQRRFAMPFHAREAHRRNGMPDGGIWARFLQIDCGLRDLPETRATSARIPPAEPDRRSGACCS